MKRFIGAFYGIILEPILRKIKYWSEDFEKDYLHYCTHGCKNCYKYMCGMRSSYEGTPYKKFRRRSQSSILTRRVYGKDTED